MENLNPNSSNRNNIFNQIRMDLKKISLETKREHPFNKGYLWKLFKHEFQLLHGKTFFDDKIVAKNIEPIFHYFLEAEAFFECENLRHGISAPSFKKGLLLIGNVGVGKSHIMMVFKKIFENYPPHRFAIIPTNEVVDKYEEIITPEDRKLFYKIHTSSTILFDDLNSEKIANNYGHLNIMKEIIFRRNALNKKTHLTMNPLSGFENDISGSLLKLGDKYDHRTIDRLFEMFNVIEFKGKSMRR